MPTYDYECTECGHRFEAFQSMSDKLLKKCPECGGKLRRLIGAGAGLIFKGSGFYITDYRSKDYQAKAKSDSGDGGSTPKSDTKTPAATPAATPAGTPAATPAATSAPASKSKSRSAKKK